jgi:hypothetical protein
MERGNSFEAPKWWLRLARRELADRGSYKKLSTELAALVGRKKPWHHATLSRFATNDPGMKPSQEFAVALSLYFEIPSPVYIPRSLAEARAMQATHELVSLLSRQRAKSDDKLSCEAERGGPVVVD